MDIQAFAKEHVTQISATIALVTYATTRKKLTPAGIVSGIIVAIIHMIHPWQAFFWLLMVFFLLGTVVTKIGHTKKAHLTQSAAGGTGGEGARSAVQVFANSGWASILIAIHAYLLHNKSPFISSVVPGLTAGPHFPILEKLLPIGIIAQYAAVAADTFSSELGILSKQNPFLITAPWKSVPKGTNGGVTIDGFKYAGLGSSLLVAVAIASLTLSPPHVDVQPQITVTLIAAGIAGSIIDSVLGALCQVTVSDKGTGKVVEGPGGTRVKVLPGGTRVQVGKDLLTNNGVNFVMAALASLGAMGVAAVLGLELRVLKG
ncbi:hypothetical protein CKM354_000477200 [Cercospora kikuchii]|uniref:Transmembrane protein 19 n=1 Tax=Cercospora kikuchii TaxID=84275 RepID=A0A9P3CC20_9PEZI|nr:uncharacterized protein CKM354_000477200 [Cercospora kikuchii]GIZ41469.1 hypothetical protein CKM354_000477200 [Cercospora kikuchii]